MRCLRGANKMDNQEFVKDQIDRYVYQVSRFLTGKNKDDIEKEIRTLIDDMLDTRCQDRYASKDDLTAVFAELGKPSELAARYNDSKRYLIGPALFPIYSSVLKVVLGFVIAATLLSNVLSIISGSFTWTNLGNIFSEALGFFAIVTIVFAFVEWKGLSIDAIFSGEMDGKMDGIFNGKINLPPVPEMKARISRSEPIVGLVFLGIFIVVFAFAPQYIGFWNAEGAEFVSIFDLAVIRSVLWIFLISFAASAVKEIIKLIEGRYTIRLMLVTIFCNAVNLILVIYIIRNYPIWNDNFPAQFMAAAQISGLTILRDNWNLITRDICIGLIAFGTTVDTLSCIIKTLVYGLRNQEK